MPLHDARSLLAVLHEHDLVAKTPLDGLRPLAGQFPAAAELARELVRRGLITPFQANEIMQDRAGRLVLGQYLLLERLGQGGMGEVFKARHRVLDRFVALKVIRAEFVDRPDAVERFRRECRAAGLLSHPNIVTVHDAHQVGSIHFLAMEYLEGKDLGRLVKERGALPPGEACEYARQAALGLQHAHEKGMVHRDVKPANLMRTTAGVVKVLDMGLARLRAGPDGAAEPRSDLTQAGSVMGTPDYIAPEQAAGNTAQADTRSDVYSLGCTLFHLLAGRPPFLGKTVHEKIVAHLNQPPPSLDSIRPGLPAGLAAVVRRMMEKAPAARYPTPGAVAAALAPYCQLPAAVPLSNPGVGTVGPVTTTLTQYPRPPRPFPWRWAAAAGAALLLVLLSCGIGSWLLSSPPSGPGKPPDAKPPDAGPPHDKDNVAVHNPKDGPRPPDPPGPNPGPKVVDPVVPLPPPPKNVAVRDNLPWPPPECAALLGDASGRHWAEVGALAVRPDGQVIATADKIGERAFIHIWDAKTLKERIAWTPAGVFVEELAYSPDGRRLAAVCGDGLRLWDAGDDGLKSERKFGEPGAGPGSNIFHALFTTDGRWLLTRDAAGALRRWRLTDREPVEDDESVPAPQGVPAFGLAVSADGLVEAYSRLNAGTGKYQVCVKALFAKDANERTAEMSAAPGVLALSEDGKCLAAQVGRFGAGELRFWDIDDKGLTERKKKADPAGIPGLSDGPSSLLFTPDGSHVLGAFTPRGGAAVLLIFDATTGETKQLTGVDGSVTHLGFSADGKTLAVGGRDQQLSLWEDTGAGLGKRRLNSAAGLVRRLSFRPNGAELAAVSRLDERPEGSSDLSNLIVWDLAKGTARQVISSPGWFTDCAYTPDGARLFATGTASTKAAPFSPREGFLRVWQADPWKEEDPPKLPAKFRGTSLEVLAFDRQGKTLALLGGDDYARKACVCDAQPFRVRGEPFDVGQRLESLALSPDGETAAALGVRRTGAEPVPFVKFWDVKNIEKGGAADVEPKFPLEGAAGQMGGRRLTYSPDGKTIAALVQGGQFPDSPGKVLLWDIATGSTRAVGDLNDHRLMRVEAFAFSPDGRTIATADADGRVTLWRADKPEEKVREWVFPGRTTAVAFSPGGDYLAVGDGDGTVAVLRLPAPPGGK